MNIPKPEKTWTWGNIISIAVSVTMLISMFYSGAAKFAWTDKSVAEIPSLRDRVTKLEEGQVDLNHSISDMKDRRAEDIQAMQAMRAEIVGRLDRIENKLDQKADKQTQLREWTR